MALFMVKPWWQSKTIWLNLVTAVAAAVGAVVADPVIAKYPQVIAALVLTQAVLNVLLRIITDTKIE